MATITLDDAQFSLLDRLAGERQVSPDALVSAALSEFFARETVRREREQINAAYLGYPDDVEAQKEEASLFAARRWARRRLHRETPGDDGAEW